MSPVLKGFGRANVEGFTCWIAGVWLVEGPRLAGSIVPAGLLSGLGAARRRHRLLRLLLRLLGVGVVLGRAPVLERAA